MEDPIKVLLLGSSRAGKTQIFLNLQGKSFEATAKCTISPDIFTVEKQINSKQYRFQLWDTAGQERLGRNSVSRMYFRSARAAVFIYDINVDQSANLTSLKEWLKIAKEQSGEHISAWVVANKIDQVQSRDYDNQEILSWCSENKFTHFYVSAKTGENVIRSFDEIYQQIIFTQQKRTNINVNSNSNSKTNQPSMKPTSNPSKRAASEINSAAQLTAAAAPSSTSRSSNNFPTVNSSQSNPNVNNTVNLNKNQKRPKKSWFRCQLI